MVDEYGDRYSNWRNFDRNGELADPGWRDLHGVDPLNSVEMANRAVSVDPTTHRFHAIDQAIMVAKIGDVLGAGFEQHAIVSLDRLVPKDPESARALVPEHLLDEDLRGWIAGSARGGFMSETGLIFVAPHSADGPRPISAVAATLVHEGMHLLQPNSALLGPAVQAAAGALPDADVVTTRALADIRLDGELAAFTVQQAFLRGLAGHHAGADLSADPRVPRSDDYRNLAASRPEELEARVRSDYRTGESDTPGRALVDRYPEMTAAATVARADTAIANSTHPLAGERLQGTFHGPLTTRVVEQFGIDLAAIQRQQTDQGWPPMRDDGTASRSDGSAPRTPDAGRVEPPDRGDRVGPPVQEERSSPGPTHAAAPIEGTGFVPDGRPGYVPDVSVFELQGATQRLSPDDFAGSVAWIQPEGPLVRVQGTDGRPHYFRPEIGRDLPNVAETSVRAGTPDDPHRTVVNNRVAAENLPRVWVQSITETLQERTATAERAQPQGVLRRAINRIGGFFGRTEPHPEPLTRPSADPYRTGPGTDPATRPAGDPHTRARLGERRFLLRELNESWHPDEQARLRQEIAAVDREVARLGHPLAELDPLPETGAVPDPFGADPRPSTEATNDGVWIDPAWRRDDRPPSLDELLPTTDAEATKWADTIRQTVADLFEGREFAGMRLRFDLTDEHSVSVYRNDVTIRADVVDPERGVVGRVVRAFHRDHDGSLYAEHVSLKLYESAQGRGFASAFNRYLEQWYHYSGVDRIEIHAASTVGGYAWARAGYDWAPNTEHRADAVLDRLRSELRDVDADLDQLARWTAGDDTVDADRLRQRYPGPSPEEMTADAHRQRAAGQQILDRAAGHRFGSDGYPTPFDISQAGWHDQHGRDATWIGKRALLGADWKGVKPIADEGPRFTRDPAAVRPHSDLPVRPITAAQVPDSQFHGHLRDTPEPETVGRAGRDALDQIRHRLPVGHPLRTTPIEVTTVPAERLPDRAVARSVPVDADGVDLPAGRVPPEDGGYRVELSDRAGEHAIARAVAHEVAELAAIRQRADAGLDLSVPDVLRPGEHVDGATLSPHDLGRLAEVEVLADLLDDPATAAHARSELDRLRDHLGLRPDDPGAADRFALIGPHLGDAGRAALRADGGPPPTRTLRIIAYDGGRGGDLPARLATELGAGGDRVVVRTPGVGSRDLGPGARVSGADPIPGVTGPISPLLRLDGQPADADVVIGFGETAGIADVRRDAYPHARIVQVVDTVPDAAHLAVLARADLIVTADPRLATEIRSQLAGLGADRVPPVHVLGPDGAAGLHDAIHGLGDGVARVDEATWRQEISLRDVVLRSAAAEPSDGATRVMTVCTEWWSSRGGIPTANRELTEAFGSAGTVTFARVSTVDSGDLSVTSAEPAGVRVVGVDHVWGVLDAKGEPDTRAMTLLPQNLPAHVDVVVGHSRFGGGVARLLVEQVYPGARYVHVLHTSPEVLDALRGNPAEGLGHAATERILMSGADVAAGVGPLLGLEAGRLGSEAQVPPPTVHRIISDMPRIEGDPPPRPADRTHFEIAVQGRAGDPIKGIEFAARLVPLLAEEGVPVRLTVRGAPTQKAADEQAAQLSELAGAEVVVKPFTRDQAALLQDLYDADLVMMPSIHEGFGLVASEAARAGVPVVVGEGTGAGLFFGDPGQVPAGLGEPATVRDGITVDVLRQLLLDAADPDGVVDGPAMRRVLDEIDQRRTPAWVDHVGTALRNLAEHRARALDLRDYLAETFPPGNAAQRLIAAMRGEPAADGAPPQQRAANGAGPRGAHVADGAGPAAERSAPTGANQRGGHVADGAGPAAERSAPTGANQRGGHVADGAGPAPDRSAPTADRQTKADGTVDRPPAVAGPETAATRPGTAESRPVSPGRVPVRETAVPAQPGPRSDAGPPADATPEVAPALDEHSDLARILRASPELAHSLAARPATRQHLASYPQAIEVLQRVLDDIRTRGAEAVVADGTPVPESTPLTPEQRAISAAVEVLGSRYQTGFDHRRIGDAEYRSAFLDRMYEQAAVAQDELRGMVVRIAAETGGEPGWRPGPKDRVRAEDKIREYRGDVSKLTDLAGAKIEFRSLDDLYQALARLIDEPGVRIVKFKDRFENPQDSGYRDVQMSVRASNGHVAELRLHLTSLDEVAAWEHALYEVRRDLDALAEELGRVLSVAETAIRDGILREEQRLFWEALRTALRGEGGE
ncbi:glycosyltransferase [Polymorphospora sp. A560]